MDSFRNLLIQGAGELGLELSDQTLQGFCEHQRQLTHWARKMNLTAITDDVEMVDRLYLDSAIVSKWLPDHASLHDVGSGAGFPGLVLKILRPDLQVTLTEARRKRVSFLKHAARVLGIDQGLSICWRRLGWEQQTIESTWQEVISRATFPPLEWIRQGERLVANQGRLWVMAGHAVANSDEALDWEASSTASLRFLEVRKYVLPFCQIERYLVSFQKVSI